jgi:hypothetical protein
VERTKRKPCFFRALHSAFADVSAGRAFAGFYGSKVARFTVDVTRLL